MQLEYALLQQMGFRVPYQVMYAVMEPPVEPTS